MSNTNDNVLTDSLPSLNVEIQGMDCTNRGVTSGRFNIRLREDLGLVVDLETPEVTKAGYVMVLKSGFFYSITGVDELDPRKRVARVRAVPIINGKAILGGMFGGHFIMSSDSRFPAETPIPVFDRFEEGF